MRPAGTASPLPSRSCRRVRAVGEWYSGTRAFASTPMVFSSSWRAAGLRLAALTTCTTTGIEASLPTARVLDRIFADSGTPSRSNATALARSIRCGKSTFHGCGGVYGHLVW